MAECVSGSRSCMQMAREPTFQLGPQYKYPWLIGMWRLLAQKGGSSPPPGASPGPRRSLTLAVTLEAVQGYPPSRLLPSHSPSTRQWPRRLLRQLRPPSFLHSLLFFSFALLLCFLPPSWLDFTFERGLGLNPTEVLICAATPPPPCIFFSKL